jgi:hypothetical protein
MMACAHCWRQVPKDLQAAVWRTWRAYLQAESTEAFTAYQAAREAALASIA